MNIHEYQGKQLLADYGIPVQNGYVVDTPENAVIACDKICGQLRWVVKVQVHAGSRGKAGGVKVVKQRSSASFFADKWLGNLLVTNQTSSGMPVDNLLVEACTSIVCELYLGVVVDRARRRIVLLASSEGGVEIENKAKIIKATIQIQNKYQNQYQALALKLQLKFPKLFTQLTYIFLVLTQMFLDNDIELIEINPLVITNNGNLYCLDVKINIDDNALFRHPKLRSMRDINQEDSREAYAEEWGLNYVALDGNIGCMVNGAGLAMGMMDIIKQNCGKPANFLDVGGATTKECVAEAFKRIISDASAVLVNIFGGIVRCDIIASGIICAIDQVGVEVPVVVRFDGTNAKSAELQLDQ